MEETGIICFIAKLLFIGLIAVAPALAALFGVAYWIDKSSTDVFHGKPQTLALYAGVATWVISVVLMMVFA